MSKLMDNIRAKAATLGKHIVLAEGEEARIVKAAIRIRDEGIAKITLLGNPDVVARVAEGADLTGINVVDHKNSPDFPRYAALLYELRKSKGLTLEAAEKLTQDPLYYGVLMIKAGDADGMVAGSICATGDVLRPALQIVKTAPGIKTVSSCFVMSLPEGSPYGDDGVMVFGDCAVNPMPDANQLADIAIASADNAAKLAGIQPRVAMLSFSTKGSAKHDVVTKVQEATALVKAARPDLMVDGELQLDAALVPSVGQLKAPGSPVAGKANVLIFPDLQAGNIGYKIAQRLGGAEAVGPVCQGFAAPVNDLSRGCSVQDVVDVVAITALQSIK